jgi:hypothetical protein
VSLTPEQVTALLKPIHPRRVLSAQGHSHVSQQDIRAHLTRIFGFGGWSSEVRSLECIAEENQDGKRWRVTYRCLLRLTVRDPDGKELAAFDDVGLGTSPNLPTRGDGHDFAAKVAVSIALKRAATNLGDGFGLSLYNRGQTSALVIDTLVKPDGTGRDVSDEVPPQVSLGHDDDGSRAPAEETPQAPAPAATPPAEPPQAAGVQELRERVLTALRIPDKSKALKALIDVQLTASKGKQLQAPTTTPAGEDTTVGDLIATAQKLVSGRDALHRPQQVAS